MSTEMLVERIAAWDSRTVSSRARMVLAMTATIAALHAPGPAVAQRASEPTLDTPEAQTLPTPPPPTITRPKVLSDTTVGYPANGRGSAEVVLELLVDPLGRVTSSTVISGPAPFAEAARRAALTWVFTPALRNGQTLAARVRFAVSFEERITEPGPEPDGTSPSAQPQPPSVDVTVAGQRVTGGERITRSAARELPGAFGDPFRVIESLPGVTPTLSGAPYFYVRGSPPSNTGLYLDGVRMPTLYHVFAGPPVIHPALIEEVEFYPGPYPARFGRATGGIAAASSRTPTHQLHGEASVRAFDSSGMVELPLGDTPSSLTLGGRFAYANPIAHLFAPNVDVGYWDYQAKFSSDPSPNDHVAVFGFGAGDSLERRDGDEVFRVIDSEFHRLDARYERQLASGSALLAATLGVDRSVSNDGRGELEAQLATLRGQLQRSLNPSLTLHAGADVGGARYRAELVRANPDERRDFDAKFRPRSESVAGAYVALDWSAAPRVRIQPGLRADVWIGEDESALGVDPRLSAEFAVNDRLTLEHALGISHQPPGNPLPQPGAIPELGAGLQTAVQSSAGFKLALPEALSLRVTVFQSLLLNLSDGPGISRLDNSVQEARESTRSTGSSRGLEVLLNRGFTRKLSGFFAYTLSSSRRSFERAEGPSLFDRRHVLSGALSQRFGAGYSLGLRVALYTGVPAAVAYLAAAENPPRTAAFHRFDLRAEKRWSIGDAGAYWAVVLEALNATLNTEVLSKSCNAYVCREQRVGPIAIPSVGLEASF